MIQMKKLGIHLFEAGKICLMFVLLYLTTSCDNMVEEITLKEDGSGTYNMYTDAITSQRTMAKQMAMMFTEEDSYINIDSLDEAIDQRIWANMPEVVDSVMDIQKEMPDSIKNDPRFADLVAGMQGYMRGSKKEGVMNTGMEMDFKDIKTLNRFDEFLQESSKGSGKAGGQMGDMEMGDTKTEFSLSDNSFSKQIIRLKEADVNEEDRKMMEMMMGAGKFTTIVHLPRAAKSVKQDHELSDDKKTVTFEYNMIDYMIGEVDANWEIEMEDK